jgi:hypothetical protein
MKHLRRVTGMFLAIFITLVGLAKVYETVMQTFVPNYDEAFHRYSGDFALWPAFCGHWRHRNLVAAAQGFYLCLGHHPRAH